MRRLLVFLALVPCILFAKKGTLETFPQGVSPWFTGPLICPSANTVAKGSYNIEPYLYVTQVPAVYDNDWHAESVPTQWMIQQVPLAWVGLTDWMDILFYPTYSWNHRTIGGGAWTLGDIGLQFEFQLYRDELPHKSWLPSIKFSLRETIPTGKYRNMNPKKFFIDQGGNGTWSTLAQLTFGRVFHLSGVRFLSLRLNLQTTFYNSIVHVKGYDAYGGGVGANGRIRPGRNYQVNLAAEYSLSRNWALALDVVGYWQSKAKFNGYGGADFILHTPTTVAKEASIQYSLAPAIEYNWDENLGIIAGTWFSVAGKQISEFYSFVFAVNYYK